MSGKVGKFYGELCAVWSVVTLQNLRHVFSDARQNSTDESLL